MSFATKRLPFARFAALLPPRQQIFKPPLVTVSEAREENAQVPVPALPVFSALPFEGVERLTRRRQTVPTDEKMLRAIYDPDPFNLREYMQGKAHNFVNQAVLQGQLADLKKYNVGCVDCGKRATCYDHRDYARPLDVDPVCDSCNCLRGPAINWLPEASLE